MNSKKKKNGLQVEIAKFISELQYDRIPSHIIDDAKYRVLDWLGSALAGVSYKPSQIITAMVRSAGGAHQSTVLKGCIKVPAPLAAFANGVIGHVAEFDDGHRLAVAHPGAIAVPTSLAVAECFNKTGKDLLTAIVAGYEVLIRLGTSVNPAHYARWHPTGTCGTFAAATCTSSLLHLDKRKTQMSLGIAGTMASGLQETFGTHAKPLNAGHACQSGIQAALLAKEGFTGPEDILLGEKGFIKATASEYDTHALEEINDGRLLLTTAFYKVYASCGHTNSPLDALFTIMSRHDIPVQSIKHIKIETYRVAVELAGQFKNQDEESAKFSLPYCCAVALLYKKVTLKEFDLSIRTNQCVADIADKIIVSEDAEATKTFPKERRASVTIELTDGRVISENMVFPHDTPSYKALDEKYLSLALASVDSQTALRIQDIVLNMEKQPDLHGLMELVR